MNSVSTRYKNIIEKLRRNEVVILDGATGSELESRGVKTVSYTHLTLPTILLV